MSHISYTFDNDHVCSRNVCDVRDDCVCAIWYMSEKPCDLSGRLMGGAGGGGMLSWPVFVFFKHFLNWNGQCGLSVFVVYMMVNGVHKVFEGCMMRAHRSNPRSKF